MVHFPFVFNLFLPFSNILIKGLDDLYMETRRSYVGQSKVCYFILSTFLQKE